MLTFSQPNPIQQILTAAAILLCLGLPTYVWAQQKPSVELNSVFEKQIRPFAENHCLDCHSQNGEGEVNLDRFLNQSDVNSDLAFWFHVLKVLEQGEMPPADQDQPSDEAKAVVENWILESIKQAGTNIKPLSRLRRLNRVEYENTIRELFRLDRDCFCNSARVIRTTDYFQPATGKMPRSVFAVSYLQHAYRHSDLPGVSNLPVDPPTTHGFANDQDALSLSPLLMESYFELATALLNSKEFSQISAIYDSMFLAPKDASESELEKKAYAQISAFLPRAFRQHVLPEEIRVYTDLYDLEFAENGSYTDSMKTTISAVLVSPRFLFRSEFLPEPVTDSTIANRDVELERNYAMANRLSYFLWGSMPDAELFQAAHKKQLTKSAELARQVERMMNDQKIKSLATDFGMQWLKVSKVVSSAPDKSLYTNFYKPQMPPISLSMTIEQLLFFEAVMVENRSILEFIQSDFGYLNRQLMEWYQLDIEKSVAFAGETEDFEDFFRVEWNNPNRGGVITSGATLVGTSTTTRTSPVFRGAWILDVIFNAPPPPAPADIPPLEVNKFHKNKLFNVREKLEAHRADASCAVCHSRIDPLGFALEDFNAVGRWRTEYEKGGLIDASGKLDGVEFDGPARFKNTILQNKPKFTKAFIEHTMKYALGRQLHYSDEPEIRRLTDNVISEDYRFRSVIRQVVLSKMFRRFDSVPDEINTAQPAAAPNINHR